MNKYSFTDFMFKLNVRLIEQRDVRQSNHSVCLTSKSAIKKHERSSICRCCRILSLRLLLSSKNTPCTRLKIADINFWHWPSTYFVSRETPRDRDLEDPP